VEVGALKGLVLDLSEHLRNSQARICLLRDS